MTQPEVSLSLPRLAERAAFAPLRLTHREAHTYCRLFVLGDNKLQRNGLVWAFGLLVGSLNAGLARADCAPLALGLVIDPARIICDGLDEDGFAYNLPDVTVEILGTVRSPSSTGTGLFLSGANNLVINSGDVVGPGTGIDAANSVTITNGAGALISGDAGPAISAAISGEIDNFGTIRSLTGIAIEAATNLNVGNFGGTILTFGAEDGISAGISATIQNDQAGVISSLSGVTIRAGSGLSFTNTGSTVTNLSTGGAISADDGANIINLGGEILSAADTAIAVTTNGTISNAAGSLISSTEGAAITAQSGVEITNTASTIESLNSEPTIRAGISATIRNQPDGRISSLAGTTIGANALLDLRNGPLATISNTLGKAVDAGLSATVRNSGTISGRLGGVELNASSSLFNDLGGRINSEFGPTVLGNGTVRIHNSANALIHNTGDGASVELRTPDKAELINRGEVRSARGPTVEIGSGGDALIDNGFGAEIRSDADGSIVTRAAETTIENEGDIRADATAIHQTGGARVDLFNRATGRIESTSGAAVDVRDGRYVNETRGVISGYSEGLVASAGRLENSGRIEARDTRDGVGVRVGAGAEDMEIINDGEIVGVTGALLSDANSGRHLVDNAGRIEGTGGTAIAFGSAHDRSTLQLRGESEIFGDVLFGASDDFLDIFDIASGSLITDGLFDGGAGIDTLSFASSYLASDFTSFDFVDELSVGITVTAEDGQSLYGLFRNFDTFLIGGTERSYSELHETFSAPVAPVPIPAALPMLLAGLGALGWAARRRRGLAV